MVSDDQRPIDFLRRDQGRIAALSRTAACNETGSRAQRIGRGLSAEPSDDDH
jgi:hypothetical protein